MPQLNPGFRRVPFRKGLLGLCVTLGVVSAGVRPALASSSDDEEAKDKLYDARAEGYTPTAEAKSSSTGGAWMLLFAMGVACVGVMFIDSKRSHLD